MKTFVALLLLASSTAFAEAPPADRHVYRLDFVVAEGDAGKLTSSTYTLNLEEQHSGEIRMGTNVALAGPTPGATRRADIGLTLRASFTSVGGDLLVDDEVEISAAKDPQTFRKISARGNALVAPGKSALVASVEDPISKKHYRVTVTATKLR